MKFGETLQQRSVPQWQNYNIDYTALKRLIKDHTSPVAAKSRPGTAVNIPGKGLSAQDEIDEQLLALLRKEGERLDLFVKSKKYELASRLQSIERQIQQLQQRRALQLQQSVPSSRTALALRRRFSKLESELLRVGEEIQNVSRFVASNRMAIRKVIKKHRKWTRSPSFAARVEELILKRDNSFATTDLSPIMEQYAGYLGELRTAFEERAAPSGEVQPIDTVSPVSLPCSAIDFDVVLDTPDHALQRSVYWVHQDNIVELRILLLQYMRYAHVESPSPPASLERLARRVSHSLANDQIGFVAFSNTKLSARWAGNDAAVTLSEQKPCSTKLSRQRLPSFVAPVRAKSGRDSSDDMASLADESGRDRECISSWIAAHSDVSPLAQACAARSRLVGLEETAWPGVRAALDQDVRMARTTADQLQRGDFCKPSTISAMDTFPHAILTVVSGEDDGGIFAALDATHLTERVHGFCPKLHAIATCCKPNALPEPPWLSKLNQDIRHLPPASDPSSRRSSNTESVPNLSPKNHKSQSSQSVSAEEAVTPDASMPLAHESSRRLGHHVALAKAEPPVRYWNEFDNGSEFGNDGAYTIYVDPNEPVFPALTRFIAWQKSLYSIISSKASSLSSRDKKKNRNSVPDHSGAVAPMRRPLLDGGVPGALPSPLGYATTDDETEDPETLLDSGEEECSPRTTRMHRRNELALRAAMAGNTNYGTLSSSSMRLSHAPLEAHTVLVPSLRVPAISLAASAMLTLLLAIMATTSRKKARGEVSVAVLLGITASLLFAVLGVVGMLHAISTADDELRDIEALPVPASRRRSWLERAALIGRAKVTLGFIVAIWTATADGILAAFVLG